MTGLFVTPTPDSRTAPPRPIQRPPEFGETLGATWRTMLDDDEAGNFNNRVQAYNDVEDALVALGNDRKRYRDPQWRSFLSTPETAPQRFDALWRDVEAARTRDPKHFADLPKTRAEFDKWAYARKGARAADLETISRGGTAPWLVGTVGFGISQAAQPQNLPALVFGGAAKTIPQVLSRGFLVNSIAAAPLAIEITRSRENMGETYTANEGIADILVQGAIGSALDVGLNVAPKGIAAARDAIDPPTKRLARQLGRESIDDVTDVEVAAHFRQTVPPEIWTPEERAAVHVVERQADIDAARPFTDTPAGMDAHADKLGRAIDAMLATPAPRPARPLDGVLTDNLDQGTPLAVLQGRVSREDAPGAAAAFKAKVRRAESGGNDAAKNPLSSATGRYQFTAGTWLSTYRKVNGDTGENAAAILAKRSDGALQDRLMNRLTADNEAALRRAGQPVTPGNLYLTHFAGEGGAVKILRAAPGTPIERVLTPDAIAANPFLRGKTVDDVAAWADRKMGGPGAVARGDAGDADPALARNPDLDAVRPTAAIDDDIDWSPPPMLRRDMFPDDDSHALAQEASDRAHQGIEPDAPVAAAPAPAPERAPVSDVQRAAAKAYIFNPRNPSLEKPAALAKELGITRAEARALIERMAAEGEGNGLVAGASGKLRRAPQPKKPLDVLDFVVRAGGIRNDGAHDLIGAGIKRRTGWGYVLNNKGRSIDEIGELLHEAGYFPGRAERPTEDDVLQLLLDASRGGPKRVADADIDDQAAIDAAVADEFFKMQRIDEIETALDAFGFDHSGLTPEEKLDIAMNASAVGSIDQAAFEVVRDSSASTLDDMARLLDDADYDIREYDADGLEIRDTADGENQGGPDQGDDGSPPPRSDADRSGAQPGEFDGAGNSGAARDEADAEQPGQPDLDSLSAFDDPAGPGAKAVADSLTHDIRTELDAGAAIDPAIAERQRQQAALKAAAPMRSTAEQDGTMGSPLFDAADQPTFRMDEGDERAADEILNELDADDAAIKAARDCL